MVLSEGMPGSKDFLRVRKALLDQRRRRQKELTEEAWEKAKAVAGLLKNNYGVQEVLLYGSLAWGDFHQGSDIDLLISGLQDSYWRMYLEAEALARPFPVSIVCIEDATPSLREVALKKGVSL